MGRDIILARGPEILKNRGSQALHTVVLFLILVPRGLTMVGLKRLPVLTLKMVVMMMSWKRVSSHLLGVVISKRRGLILFLAVGQKWLVRLRMRMRMNAQRRN